MRQALHTLVLAVLLMSSTAHAQLRDDAADVAFRQGTELFRQGKYEAARSSLAQAFAQKRTFDIAVALGFAEVKLDHWQSGATLLAWSLRHWAPTGKPASRESAVHWLEEAKKRVGAIHLRLNVDGARVTIDGAAVEPEEIAAELFVDPGTHTAIARHEGHQDARVTFNASPGSSQDVKLTLSPAAAGRRSVVPGAILGGVAGAALATGIGLYAGGRAKESSAHDLHDAILKDGRTCVAGGANYDARCSDLQGTASTSNTLQKAGVGVLVVAGAAALGTVIYFVLPAPRSSSNALRIMPTLSPAAAGLLFSGSF